MNILYTNISSQVVTILPFGGPISADPLFIKSLNDTPLGLKAFELLEPDSDSQKTTQ